MVNFRLRLLFSLTLLLTCGAIQLSAQETDENLDRRQAVARLTGFKEVPSVVTSGRGVFHADLIEDAGEISYTLEYSDLEGDVTEVLVHLGRPATHGGIRCFFAAICWAAPMKLNPVRLIQPRFPAPSLQRTCRPLPIRGWKREIWKIFFDPFEPAPPMSTSTPMPFPMARFGARSDAPGSFAVMRPISPVSSPKNKQGTNKKGTAFAVPFLFRTI